MCGINGILGFKSSQEEAVEKMNKRLAHRGPDDSGVFADEAIAMGQRRLSIIDLSNAGHQPMRSNDNRYVLVFNGEIYNFRELKKQLNYPFISGTDSEVILAAYEKWGKDCVAHFNGMFAFAIWDKKENELFIARDRLGIKPLYFHKNEKGLVFSSEIRALLASGKIYKKLSESGLREYLMYQTVHAPNTILEDVKMLEPGTFMTAKIVTDKLEATTETYWKPEINSKKYEELTYSEAKELIKKTFESAVEKRLVADVPFGAFLSGGIDSSAIVGVMSKVAKKRVKTFNISFAEEEFSEAKYARIIAKKFDTDHHEIKLSPEYFLEHLPSALKAMDHPSGDGPNTWVVSKATKEAGITMALSGLGGDELFAGYPVFKRMHKLHQRQWLWKSPKFIRESAGFLIKKAKPGVAANKMADLINLKEYDFSKIHGISRQVLLSDQADALLSNNGLQKEIGKASTNLQNKSLTGNHLLSSISIAEMSTYMQNVLLRDSDQMSMAHALEVRVPFLDHELVELALNISDSHKFPVTPKKLLIDSLGNLLPPEIVNRPKMGFTFPWEHWLKNELFDLGDKHLRNLAQRSYFNSDAVIALWVKFCSNDPSVTYSRIWPLVVLDCWMTENNIE